MYERSTIFDIHSIRVSLCLKKKYLDSMNCARSKSLEFLIEVVFFLFQGVVGRRKKTLVTESSARSRTTYGRGQTFGRSKSDR